jgi:hypothetical protein
MGKKAKRGAKKIAEEEVSEDEAPQTQEKPKKAAAKTAFDIKEVFS